MDKIKNYTLIALTIICMILLLTKGCGEKCPQQTVIGSYDTLIRWDTIKLKDTIEIAVKKPVSKPTESEPTIGLDTSISKTTNTYSDSAETNDVTIYYKAKTVGILQGIDLSAKIKNRKIIKETVNYYYHDTTYKQPKFSLYGGMAIKGSRASFDVSPFITANFKNNSLTISYDVLKGEYGIGVGYKIWNSKK